MSDRRCGTCEYRTPYFDSFIGKLLDGLKQPCVWDGPKPFYMTNKWVEADEGTGCPTWKERAQ